MTNERFNSEVGCHYDPMYICSLSDEELAAEIRELDSWDDDLCRDLCWRADMLDEWESADDDFESVVYAAAKKLGVEI